MGVDVTEGTAFALVGVLIGVLITSAYNFWSVRRQELVRGSAAARSLDDEMAWLVKQLEEAVSTRRAVFLGAPSAVSMWRERREAVVLWVDAGTSLLLADALRGCERWEAEIMPDRRGRLRSRDVERAQEALETLGQARLVVASLSAYLWTEHEVFILLTLIRAGGRMVKRMLRMKTGWRPPTARASSRRSPTPIAVS